MTLARYHRPPGRLPPKAPFPRLIPPCQNHQKGPEGVQPNTPLDGMPLWHCRPERPVRRRWGNRCASTRHSLGMPLSVHGLMHQRDRQCLAWRPYKIDTLLLFMANMAWNSSMNTAQVREMLVDRTGTRHSQDPVHHRVRCVPVGDGRIRRWLETRPPGAPTRFPVRPSISSSTAVDSVRIPVVPAKGQCKPFQEVLIEAAGDAALRLPAFVDQKGEPQVPRHRLHHQLQRLRRVRDRLSVRLARQGGFQFLKGERPQIRWEMCAAEQLCVFHYELLIISTCRQRPGTKVTGMGACPA